MLYALNKHTISRSLMSLLTLLCIATISSASTQVADTYRKWDKVSPLELFEKGKHFIGTNSPDSAMMCFTIITNKAGKPNGSYKNELAARAFLGKWTIIFYNYFDYSRSLDYLRQADEYCCGDNEIKMLIDMRYGITYHTVGVQCRDSAYMEKAYTYYMNSMKAAMQTDNREVLDVVVSNLLELSFNTNNIARMKRVWNTCLKAKPHDNDTIFNYNRLMYDGFLYAANKDYAASIKCFHHQMAYIKGKDICLRYKLMTYINMARVLSMAGYPNEAIACLAHPKRIADSLAIKDSQLEIYKLLKTYYLQVGQRDSSIACHTKYLDIKDNILTLRLLKVLGEQIYISKLQEAAEQTKQINEQRRKITIILYCMIAITTAVVIAFLAIRRKNLQLKEKNMMLYKNMQSVLEAKKRDNSEKYKNSSLNDETKQMIQKKIDEVMTYNTEYLSSDFTINRLAELIDEQSKYVSQTINELYECNFNALVNRFRIEEACRRMKDTANYGNLTIEGIAHSVGFKARSSFFKAFKNNTGMTPTEFMEIAKSEEISAHLQEPV